MSKSTETAMMMFANLSNIMGYLIGYINLLELEKTPTYSDEWHVAEAR
jgi:hypothetical protein